MASPFVKQVVTIDTITWTPISPPWACNSIVVKNGDLGNEIKIRTDSADSSTEDTIPEGSQEIMAIVPRPPHLGAPGYDGQSWFIPGKTYLYVQSVVGTGPAVVTYSR